MTSPSSPPSRRPAAITVAELLDRYHGFLLDAYGVLVDGAGALPGARELIAELTSRGTPFFLLTNDASRLPATWAAQCARLSLEVDADRVITSGSLIAPYFERHSLRGARCLVLGTDDSRTFVTRAGGVVCPIDPDLDVNVVVVCDDDGYPVLDGVNAALSAAIRAHDAGRDLRLVLPNPDLIFPAGPGRYGVTSGAIAAMIEVSLERRFPGAAPRFERLGKPYRPLFDEGLRRLELAPGQRAVMIGDQLETDVAGALGAGIDAALLHTGVTRWRPESTGDRGGAGAGSGDAPGVVPTYLIEGLT